MEQKPDALRPVSPPLTEDELCALRAAMQSLLARQVSLYTHGESTSVPGEIAAELLESLFFTLHLDTADALRCRAVLGGDPSTALVEGQARLRRQVQRSWLFYQTLCARRSPVENRALCDTLRSIGTVYRRYDPLFFACRLPCDIDYPLSVPVPETLRGLDYLDEYLHLLAWEDRFLRRFDAQAVLALERGAVPRGSGLPPNLFEPVAAVALGLCMTGGDVRSLRLRSIDRQSIAALLEPLPRSAGEALLLRSAHALSQMLDATSGEATLLTSFSRSLWPRIHAAESGGSAPLLAIFPEPAEC